MNFKKYGLIKLFRRGSRFLHKNSPNLNDNHHLQNLSKLLGISETRAHYICMKHPVIAKLDDKKLKSLLDTICEMGFSNDALLQEPGLFGILPITLKFRYKVLDECGIKDITPTHLGSYLTFLRQKTIRDLKDLSVLPSHINIENKLASYMTQWPTSLTTMIYEDVNNSTLFDLRLKIVQRYLELVLDLTSNEFYRGIETYPTIKHRPLEYINETLSLLQSQIMIPKHKIKSNLYLVHVDPDNLKKLIYKFKSIGGIDIKEVLRMHPKIATRSYNSLLETRKVLEEHGISNDAQMRCFDIYTLAPETVRERLENAKSIPEFSALFNHQRFLKMIHYNKTAMKRLNKLYSSDKKCLSLNILSGSRAHYETFERAPGDRLGKGTDLIFCISQSLGKKFKMNRIRNIIKRHPFWMNIPVVQAKYIYEQLSSQFSDEDIYDNCLILLYPWKKIRETIKIIDKKQIRSVMPFLHDQFKCDTLSNSQKLSLVLYILEKNHYFSGNGVWYDEKNRSVEKQQVIEQELNNDKLLLPLSVELK